MMKKFYTLGLAILSAGFAMSQTIEIHDANGNTISGQQLVIDSAATADHTYGDYYLVNVSGQDQTVTWSRVRWAHQSPYWDQVCDDILCFDAADQHLYPRPASFTILAGDSSVFNPKVYPEGTAGCAIYSYKVYTGLGTLQDSIQVKYRFGGVDCFASIEDEAETAEFNAYPNPAANEFYINIQTNNQQVTFVMYNVLGEEVVRTGLTDGVNTIGLNEFNNGVYFYSIVQNGEIIETKKLVVRH